MKINIRDQLPKYLGEVKLLTTKCCILEVEKLGPGNQANFYRRNRKAKATVVGSFDRRQYFTKKSPSLLHGKIT
jgi:hypothetical protein